MRRRYWYTEWHNPVRNCIWGSVRGFWSSNELAVLHCNLVYKCRINLFACETVFTGKRVPAVWRVIIYSKVVSFFIFMNAISFISDADGILQIYWLQCIEVLKWLIYFTLRYLHALRWNVKYECILSCCNDQNWSKSFLIDTVFDV